MSQREYDHGKNEYAKEHRNQDREPAQHTKHYLGNEVLRNYGVKPDSYPTISGVNYRMGSPASNGRDTKVDNAIISEHFPDTRHGTGGFDSAKLAANGVNNRQQLEGLGNRWNVAKKGYAETGQPEYKKIMEDTRNTAKCHLNADLREWPLPK
jgi:hypothetical protein